MGDHLTRDTMIMVLDKVLVKMQQNIRETDDLIKDVNQSMMKYLSQTGNSFDDSQNQ